MPGQREARSIAQWVDEAEMKTRHIVLALAALLVGGLTGYQLARCQFTPGARVLAEWVKHEVPAKTAYDPRASGTIREDPCLVITGNTTTQEWQLVLMSQVKGQSKEEIAAFLTIWSNLYAKGADLPMTIQINIATNLPVEVLQESLSFVAQYGFKHVQVNGLLAGHNYAQP